MKAQEWIRTKSLRMAIKEQGLSSLYKKLEMIVPDITHQYSGFDVDTDYLKTKVRGQHSFQIALVNEVFNGGTIIDVGDSAGTHIQYLKALHKDVSALSVNIDKEAVKRIEAKGLDVVHDSDLSALRANTFLLFQVLEHQEDPCKFLRCLETKCLIVTVPYLSRSRVGLHHIRKGFEREVTSENTHIFELSPTDWRLIFKYTEWEVQLEKIYLQYPKRLSLLKHYWRWCDFEGFVGFILTPALKGGTEL